jgi:hypothetical protein
MEFTFKVNNDTFFSRFSMRVIIDSIIQQVLAWDLDIVFIVSSWKLLWSLAMLLYNCCILVNAFMVDVSSDTFFRDDDIDPIWPFIESNIDGLIPTDDISCDDVIVLIFPSLRTILILIDVFTHIIDDIIYNGRILLHASSLSTSGRIGVISISPALERRESYHISLGTLCHLLPYFIMYRSFLTLER